MPGTSPTAVSVSASSNCASPKSSRRTETPGPSASRTFDGLTSRCTIPSACACARPSRICEAVSTATASSTSPRGSPRGACARPRTRRRCRRSARRSRSRTHGRSADGAGGRPPLPRARRGTRPCPRAARSSAPRRARSSRRAPTRPSPSLRCPACAAAGSDPGRVRGQRELERCWTPFKGLAAAARTPFKPPTWLDWLLRDRSRRRHRVRLLRRA